MNEQLYQYVMNKYPEMQEQQWQAESTALGAEDVFSELTYQEQFQGQMFDTVLYYPTDDQSDIELYPFEVFKGEALIALGYMNKNNQYIIYVQTETS